jgi:uncharacterized protein (UPF0333 family)
MIADRQNLIDLIGMENTMNGSRVIYTYREIKKQYIYAKCQHKGCRAEFRFKKTNHSEIYHLFKE